MLEVSIALADKPGTEQRALGCPVSRGVIPCALGTTREWQDGPWGAGGAACCAFPA